MAKATDRMEKVSEIVDRLLQEIKLEDLVILAAGAAAGSQGYTPMSAIIKAMSQKDGGTAVDSGAADLWARIKSNPLIPGWIMQFGLGGLIIDMLVGGQASGNTEKDQQAAEKAMIGLAAVGMIEAYAITRPGAIQGIADIIGSLAGAISGVGSNAAAAALLVPK